MRPCLSFFGVHFVHQMKERIFIMKNNVTELVFIIDRSGSMAGLEKDTVGGFNAMVKKQKKEDGVCYLSTILFNNGAKVIHDRISIENVPEMTEDDYTVGGCTALLDAIGDAIKHIGNIHKYARKEDVPDKTVFVITTDGMENASRRFNSDEIKEMIERQRKKYGWEFLFIGANIDAVETASSFGIEKNRAVNYNSDSRGTRIVYDSVSNAVLKVRNRKTLENDWRREIDADYNLRHK